MGLLEKVFGKENGKAFNNFLDRLSGCEEEEEILAEPC